MNYRQIERFIDNELSPSEKRAFLIKMKYDPVLAAEVKLREEINHSLILNNMSEFVANLTPQRNKTLADY